MRQRAAHADAEHHTRDSPRRICSPEEFVAETFRARLARLERPAGTDNAAGVRVLDAMAARGLPFHALTVLGMNERTFPRFILEDPFITDAVRQLVGTIPGARPALRYLASTPSPGAHTRSLPQKRSGIRSRSQGGTPAS